MPKTINRLIKAIQSKNDQENNDCQWILLVDELLAKDGDDFRSLFILEDIDVLIGVSPNSNRNSNVFEVIFPNNKKIIAKRLVFKHRNSLELNVFLAHLNFHFAKEVYTPMSSDEDMPLIDSCFPAIDKVIYSCQKPILGLKIEILLQDFVKRRNPVWILANENLSEDEILEAVKMKYISYKDENVTLLYGFYNDQLSNWCQKQGWNCVYYDDMRGSEADVIVMYDVYCIETEPYSRAKNALIILQK